VKRGTVAAPSSTLMIAFDLVTGFNEAVMKDLPEGSPPVSLPPEQQLNAAPPRSLVTNPSRMMSATPRLRHLLVVVGTPFEALLMLQDFPARTAEQGLGLQRSCVTSSIWRTGLRAVDRDRSLVMLGGARSHMVAESVAAALTRGAMEGWCPCPSWLVTSSLSLPGPPAYLAFSLEVGSAAQSPAAVLGGARSHMVAESVAAALTRGAMEVWYPCPSGLVTSSLSLPGPPAYLAFPLGVGRAAAAVDASSSALEGGLAEDVPDYTILAASMPPGCCSIGLLV
jgi:hypothetical protein